MGNSTSEQGSFSLPNVDDVCKQGGYIKRMLG